MGIVCILLAIIFFGGFTAVGYIVMNHQLVQGLMGMMAAYDPAKMTWLGIALFAVIGLFIAIPWFMLGISMRKNRRLKAEIKRLSAKRKKKKKAAVSEPKPIADEYDLDGAPEEDETKVFTGKHAE